MKLLAFRRRDGSAGLGAARDGAIVDLTARVGTESMRALLSSDDGLARARQALDAAPELDPAGLQLDLPVPDAGRILCVGVNYAHRNEEYRDGADLPAYPSLFFRTAASFVPHDAALVRPRESLQLDYEGEIALVIGRAGRRIAPETALQHVAGLTLVNEGTVRDWVRHGKFNVTQGKNFDRSGAMGPWIETGLDTLDLERLPIETRVNGELRQADTTASMIFPFARLIAYVSTFMTLQPGDVLSTGTPTGAGARFDPPRWLRAGDVVTVTVPGVGMLRNVVADEAP